MKSSFEHIQGGGNHLLGILESESAHSQTVVVVAAVHGNETGGVKACQQLLSDFLPKQIHLRGRVVCLLGNRAAFEAGRRYIDRDFNRIWGGALEQKESPSFSEHRECLELSSCIDWIQETSNGPVTVIDLHSTSSESVPFGIAYPSECTEHLMETLPLPFVIGLEGVIEGTLLHYCSEYKDFSSLVIEGGQHDNPNTVDSLYSTMVVTLAALGVIELAEFPEIESHRERLRQTTAEIPRRLKVVYRHHIERDDDFRMRAGYENFQMVASGEVVAHDKNGDVLCPRDGRVFLPLYQDQGSDGFFIVAPID